MSRWILFRIVWSPSDDENSFKLNGANDNTDAKTQTNCMADYIVISHSHHYDSNNCMVAITGGTTPIPTVGESLYKYSSVCSRWSRKTCFQIVTVVATSTAARPTMSASPSWAVTSWSTSTSTTGTILPTPRLGGSASTTGRFHAQVRMHLWCH